MGVTMKVAFSQIADFLKDDTPELNAIRQFFHTFGYLVLTEALKDSEIDYLKTRVIKAALALGALEPGDQGALRVKRSIVMHRIFESDPYCLEWFAARPEFRLLFALIGPSPRFLCSDANIFTSGAAWHRDHAPALPCLKFLYYFQNPLDDGSGDFWVLPGTHHVNDLYSNLMQSQCSWPTGKTRNLDKGYIFLKDNSQVSRLTSSEDGSQLPAVRLRVTKNDLVIIDNRILHTTTRHLVPSVRVNMSLAFVAQPISDLCDKVKIVHPNLNLAKEFDDLIQTYRSQRFAYHINLVKSSAWSRLLGESPCFPITEADAASPWDSKGSQEEIGEFHLKNIGKLVRHTELFRKSSD